MNFTAVAIIASDPTSRAGAARFLGECLEVKVLDDADQPRADVIVVIEDVVTDALLNELRRVIANETRPARPHCVIVANDFDAVDIFKVAECGITAVLPRAETDDMRLIAAVLRAGDGSVYLPPRLQGALLARLEQIRRDAVESRGLSLSGIAARERDVLELAAEGLSNAEIATRLSYSERTVKNVTYGFMTRYGLKNRPHAVAYAVRSGAI
jgi:DNA-binding NarL/FixJ family response regulator